MPKPDEKALQELAASVRVKKDQAKDLRVQWEAQVATVQQFVDGNHRVWWDDRGQMHRKTLQPGEIWRTINLMPLALEVRQSRLTKNDPRWQVRGSPGMAVGPEELDAANVYLQAIYREEMWKDKIKAVIRYGDMRGLCPVVCGWDARRKRPTLDYYDPWDFYPDSAMSDVEGFTWVIIPSLKSLDWLKQNPAFDPEMAGKVDQQAKYAESGLKDTWMRERSGNQTPKGMAILDQYYHRNPKGGKIDVLYVANGVVLNPGGVATPTGYEAFGDFIDFYRPTLTDHFYSRPPCADWIDPQKTIDKLYSNVESYIDLYLQGRWRRIDKSVQIPYGGVHGQVIDASIGDIEPFPLQPLPQTHFQHLGQALAQFEQISGVHSESLGRMSGSDTSGVTIAQLSALDEQNSANAVDNLRTFLARVGAKVLKMADRYLAIPQDLTFETEPGRATTVSVVGYSARAKQSPVKGSTPLRGLESIEVEIVPGSAWNDVQKQDMVDKLLSSGWQPGQNPVIDKLVLETHTIGSQREVARMMQDLKSPDRMIAAAENEKMRNGQFVTPNASDDHAAHIRIHLEESQNLKKAGDERTTQLVLDHVQDHQLTLEQMQGAAPGPQAPER